jgi:hypothetical protein
MDTYQTFSSEKYWLVKQFDIDIDVNNLIQQALYPLYNVDNKCITLTFSNVVENGPGMQMIGKITDHHSFSIDQLIEIYETYKGEKELIHLTLNERPEKILYEPAAVLVLRNFYKSHALFNELLGLKWDTKAIFRGQVKNKLARHNLCFANFEQEPDYEKGKGTVIKIDTIPLLVDLQKKIELLTTFKNLNAEGNFYHDTGKCGISYHGDRTRNIVIGLRLGDSIPLCFNWYHKSKPLGDKVTINLNHGDLYIMSSKAVGMDWKKSSQLTLRHSAGCKKYTDIKIKKSKK